MMPLANNEQGRLESLAANVLASSANAFKRHLPPTRITAGFQKMPRTRKRDGMIAGAAVVVSTA